MMRPQKMLSHRPEEIVRELVNQIEAIADAPKPCQRRVEQGSMQERRFIEAEQENSRRRQTDQRVAHRLQHRARSPSKAG